MIRSMEINTQKLGTASRYLPPVVLRGNHRMLDHADADTSLGVRQISLVSVRIHNCQSHCTSENRFLLSFDFFEALA
jgi:hypothetical protein